MERSGPDVAVSPALLAVQAGLGLGCHVSSQAAPQDDGRPTSPVVKYCVNFVGTTRQKMPVETTPGGGCQLVGRQW